MDARRNRRRHPSDIRHRKLTCPLQPDRHPADAPPSRRRRRLRRFAPRRAASRPRRRGRGGRQLRNRSSLERRPPRRAQGLHAGRTRHHRSPAGVRSDVRRRARPRQPGVAGRLRDDAAGDPRGRLDRHAQPARPRRGPSGPLLPGVDERGVRRPAGAPAARDVLGQRQLDRAAQLLRRGQAVQRSDHHGLPPCARPRRAHRPNLQHLRRADAPRRRSRRQHPRRAGPARRTDHAARRRLANPQLLPRQRRDRRADRGARRPPHRARSTSATPTSSRFASSPNWSSS